MDAGYDASVLVQIPVTYVGHLEMVFMCFMCHYFPASLIMSFKICWLSSCRLPFQASSFFMFWTLLYVITLLRRLPPVGTSVETRFTATANMVSIII